jgi:hypothetical protein
MVFIAGLFIGVVIFAAGYNLWEGVYMAKNLGSPKVSESIGLSDGLFALILIVVALAMFRAAEWAEEKFPRAEY